MPADVVLYTTPFCFYCLRARQLLARKQVAFRDIDVRGDGDAREWLRETTGRTSVPQIFLNGEFIGGYYELMMLERDGALDKLIAAASEAEDGDRQTGERRDDR